MPGDWMAQWNPASLKSLEQAGALRQSLWKTPSPPEQRECMPYEQDGDGRLTKRLASRLIEIRDEGKQAWIELGQGEFPSTQALEASRRIGIGWHCSPPTSDRASWDAYSDAMEKWSCVLLRNPEWAQWVWPWADMVEQALWTQIHGRRPSSSTFAAPEGASERRSACWGPVGARVWKSATAFFPDGEWEDLWIGLLCHRLGLGGGLRHSQVVL